MGGMEHRADPDVFSVVHTTAPYFQLSRMPFLLCSTLEARGALYKKLRFVNVRNVGMNLGVGTFTWIFMV